jgi:hypothetical protein
VTSGEDPEKRIADLERPLQSSASASESSTHRGRVGLRLGWVALALMAVGLIAGGLVILAGRGTSVISGEPTMPPMIGGGGTVSESPSIPTPSPSVASATPGPSAAPRTGAAPVPTPPPGGQVGVSGVGEERTVACTDNGVSISGVSNKVVLTGHCGRVDVSGVENTVTIESADAIGVSGLNNHVTFHSGNPGLDNSGIGNTLGRS